MIIFEDFDTDVSPLIIEANALKEEVNRLTEENEALKSKLITPKDTEESDS